MRLEVIDGAPASDSNEFHQLMSEEMNRSGIAGDTSVCLHQRRSWFDVNAIFDGGISKAKQTACRP